MQIVNNLAPTQGDKLYMVAVIERGNYPKGDYLPGHTITLRTPVRLCNSLPVELTYKLLAGDTEKRGKLCDYVFSTVI